VVRRLYASPSFMTWVHSCDSGLFGWMVPPQVTYRITLEG
jgi:hypothetical protein